MFRSGQHQQAQPPLEHIPTQSWYPSSVLSSSSLSQTSSNLNSGTSLGPPPFSRTYPAAKQNFDPRPHSPASLLQSPSVGSPSSAFASTYPPLRDKSVEDLKRLLTDKDTYDTFLHSLDQVRNLDSLRDDLKKNNIQLASQNLEKESQLAELRNQCTIIRRTEVAAAQEKFEEVQKREKEVNGRLNISVILDRLQEAVNEADDESENLHRKLLAGEVELAEFIQKYRKLRMVYHKRVLTRLAAMSSSSPG